MPRIRKACSVDGCQDLSRAKTYCIKHYLRWRKYGNPLLRGTFCRPKKSFIYMVDPYTEPRSRKSCSLDYCTLPHYGKGFCYVHYVRKVRHGDPEKTLVNVNKGFYINSNGYKVIRIKGKSILEHRYVMQQHIGRPLERYEDVHHIDGNKLNNIVENLQILTHSQHLSHHHAQGDRQRQRIYDTLPCLVCGKPSRARQLCGSHHNTFLQGKLDPSITVPPPFYSPFNTK